VKKRNVFKRWRILFVLCTADLVLTVGERVVTVAPIHALETKILLIGLTAEFFKVKIRIWTTELSANTTGF